MSQIIQRKGNGNRLSTSIRPAEKKSATARAVATPARAGENEITFQTSEGLELRAALTRLTRHAVVFELNDPAATFRASEVLSQFKIISEGRVIYFGRAVVSNLINTGEQIIGEAKLDDLGSDTAFFLPSHESGSDLLASYNYFFQNWQAKYRISAEFKVLVTDVESYLTGVRHWLEQLEFAPRPSHGRHEAEHAILNQVAPKIITAFNGLHERFEEIICALPPEARGAHQDFVRQHWHKLFLCSPFGHRTYHKPIGYAGDYEMMSMIHRNQPEGRSLYEKLIHLLLVSQWPAQSVRNRAAHLEENIVNETARLTRAKKTARLLNVGCGPAMEIQKFLKRTALSDAADFTLIDFNEETLIHAGNELAEIKREFSRRTEIRTHQISVYELLKSTRKKTVAKNYDLIYCGGLFDYLAPHTARELIGLWFDELTPGGLMVIANMNDSKPFRNFIEFILDWQLIYRNRAEIFSLVPERCRELTRVIAEPTSVNLFLHIRKPES
ncbi:MAG TPA: class I SAM-dependent methyltransferase [Verrucomicrobiae bacterium]|nr:class I SAM-dependent methyltransferase [Verrucomicrobiae bacterium]